MTRRSWTDDELKVAVANATSLAGVLRLLSLKQSGSGQASVASRIRLLNLDITHFRGQAWNKGLATGIEPPNKMRLDEILVVNSPYRNSNKLRKRLIKEKLLENKCKICGLLPVWQDKVLTMRLDHINGIPTDNRIENLRLLCPNCDSQTPTFTGRNKRNNRLRREAQAKASTDEAPRPPDRAP